MSADGRDENDDDDQLLRALGARGRAGRARVDELEARATPAIGPHQRDARAGDAAPGGDARAAEVFAPLDADARARFVDAIQVGLRAATATPSATNTPARARLPSRARRRVLMAAGASGLLAAAAALLLVMTPKPPVPYALEIDGGDRRTRSGSDEAPARAPAREPPVEPTILARDSWLEIRARPDRSTPVDGAAAFVRAAGAAHATRVAVPPEISSEGVVRWRGTAAQLFGNQRGNLEIRVLIGREASRTPDEAFSADPRESRSLTGRVRVLPNQ